MPKSIKVRDCMTRHPVSFRADTDLMRAIELLLEHRLRLVQLEFVLLELLLLLVHLSLQVLVLLALVAQRQAP